MTHSFDELDDLIEVTTRLKDGANVDKIQLMLLEKRAKAKSIKIIDELYDLLIDYLGYYNSDIPKSVRSLFCEAKDVIYANIYSMEKYIKYISKDSILYDDCLEIVHILYTVYRILEVKSQESLDKSREPIIDIIECGKFIRQKENIRNRLL